MKKIALSLFSIFTTVSLCAQQVSSHPADNFRIGVAGFTFRDFDIDSTLKMCQIAGVNYLSIKDFHLPLKSSQAEIDIFKQKCAAHGVNGYTLGPIYMRSTQEIEKAFEYAKRYGAEMIIAVPNYELLPEVDKAVKKSGIRVAIHTHGPDLPLYPDAEDVWNHVRDLDPRIGICIDVGHTLRSGRNAAKDILKYHDRIFDVHMKDIDKAAPKCKETEMGRGITDSKSILKALKKINYTGVISFEYAFPPQTTFPVVVGAINYFRGLYDGMNDH